MGLLQPLPDNVGIALLSPMDKSEVRQIVAFLGDVREGLYEGDEVVTMQLQLTELLRVIKRLMDATSATKDQRRKVFFATLELRARQYREQLEERLGTRN